MKKRKQKNKSVRCVCEVCGKVFYSAEPATVCTDKSTCRVKKSQAKKAAEKLAQAFTTDMFAYNNYMQLVQRYPSIKERLDAVIFASNNAGLSANIVSLLFDVALAESNKNVITP